MSPTPRAFGAPVPTTPAPAAPARLRPSRVRHTVLGFAATLAIVTYVDRVCIAQAAPFIQAELKLSATQMGVAFSAFSLAYALFEIPGGWLGDLIGPRKVLMRVVVMWSVFTAATGYAWNLASLMVARFLFGAGEAGCFPNLTKAFMIWLPAAERTRAQAVMWLSARWAGAFTPLLVIWVMSWLSWRNTFVLFGAMGVVWAIVFYSSFRDRPQDHPGVNSAELELLRGNHAAGPTQPRVPWAKLARSRTVWLLWVQYFCLTYGWYFYVTWLPTYLRETRGLELNQNAFMFWLEGILSGHLAPDTARKVLVAALAGIPLFFGGLGCIVTGFVTPRLTRLLRDVARTRRLLALVGFSTASVLLVSSFYIGDPLLAMVAMGLASLGNDLTMPGSWSTCMDVGGSYAGTLSGSMNMMGSFGAMLAPLVIGMILDFTGRSWAVTFWISGTIYFLGGICWLFLDPVTPITAEENPT
ncbi:MAG: MFS transporter [Opitutaceae bacterium]|nr:MFS transporter [Opitutaceae bacterium]